MRNGDKDKDIGRSSAAIADGITHQYGEDYRDGAEHLDARFGQMPATNSPDDASATASPTRSMRFANLVVRERIPIVRRPQMTED